MSKTTQQRIDALEERVNELSEVLSEIIARNIPLYAVLHAEESADGAIPDRFEMDLGAHDVVLRNSYPPERYGESAFRWLGPDPITNIPVPLERSVNYRGVVHVPYRALSDEDHKALSVAIDGERVAADVSIGDQSTIAFEVPAAAGSVRMPSFILTMSFPTASEQMPGESRQRTIAVSKIEFVRNG